MTPLFFTDLPVSPEILLIDAILGAGFGSHDFAARAVVSGSAHIVECESGVKRTFWDIDVLMDTPKEALAELYAQIKKAEADHLKEIAHAH